MIDSIDIKSTLPDIFESKKLEPSPSLLQEIHQCIGEGVISNAGSNRLLWAKPAQEEWVYLAPHLINSTLLNLCNFVDQELKKDNDLISLTKLAAL